MIRMSRFLTWDSSWASTPSSSRSSRIRMMPSVTATAACSGCGRSRRRSGLAWDEVDPRHRDAGPRGQPPDDRCRAGRLGLVDRLGPVHRQDDLVREPVAARSSSTSANTKAITMPCCPPRRPPTAMSMTVRTRQEQRRLQHVGHRRLPFRSRTGVAPPARQVSPGKLADGPSTVKHGARVEAPSRLFA